MRRHATWHRPEPDSKFIRPTNPVGGVRQAHVTHWSVRILWSGNRVRRVTALNPGCQFDGAYTLNWPTPVTTLRQFPQIPSRCISAATGPAA